MTNVLDEEAQALIERFAADYGGKISDFSDIEKLAPTIGVKYGTLLALAANLSCTQLDFDKSRYLTRRALSAGVTADEIVEAAQLLCCIGIHACTIGVRALVARLDPDGTRRVAENDADPARVALRDAFKEKRGYWNQNWEALLWLSPDYFDTYTEMSAAPWESDILPAKIRELMVIVADTLPSHHHEVGTSVHVDLAFETGATRKEILEAAAIASSVGASTVEMAVSHLAACLDTGQPSPGA